MASATFSGRSPPARMIGVSPRIRCNSSETRVHGSATPVPPSVPGTNASSEQAVAEPHQLLSRSPEESSPATRTTGQITRVDSAPGRRRCDARRPAVKLNDVESQRNRRCAAMSVGALIGEDADAPNARRRSHAGQRAARSATVSDRGPPAKMTPTYAAPSDDRELRVLGSRQPAELDLSRHGQSSERPSTCATPAAASAAADKTPIQRAQRRPRGERRVPRRPVPTHRSRRSR